MSNPIDTKQRAGGVLFAVAFLACSALLLSQITSQTKFSSNGQLFAQPRFWPGVGVVGMVVFGTLHLIHTWRARVGGDWAEGLVWLQVLEFFVWFMIYVWAVPVIGYLLATILFTCLLAARKGYRSLKWQITAALTAICIVLIFKTGLSVKIPGGAIYEYLPNGLRSFMILNF
jgi:hypothetical protein